jgi:hypothetical protein
MYHLGQHTYWVNLCGASNRATQFTGYIGGGLCGASGTHFTGLVRVCRLTPELLASAKVKVVGAQRSHFPRPWAQFHKTW